MTAALIILGSLWLMFSLFLYAWLGPAGSAQLWNNAVDRWHEAISDHD